MRRREESGSSSREPSIHRTSSPAGAAVAVNPMSGGTAFRYQPLLSATPRSGPSRRLARRACSCPTTFRGCAGLPAGASCSALSPPTDSDEGTFSALSSRRDNLFVRLAATRSASCATMVFQGAATDLNFEEWQLGVRTYGSTEPFATIASSATPVQNGLLTEWIPPAPGMYEARLLAKDRAGNIRSRTVAFGYSLSPAVANVSRSRVLLPNGDGVLDTTELHYTITRATIADFQILDSRNQVVRQ